MKTLISLLLLCGLGKAAQIDTDARVFLQNAVAQGVPVVLTNVTPIIKLGTTFVAVTNIAGGAAASGLAGFDNNGYTNLNAASQLTNCAEVIIAANTLGVTGARVHGEWGVTMPRNVANSNRFTISFGASTVLDTGMQPCSNTVVLARVLIVRTGASAQHVEAFLRWNVCGAGFVETNANLEFTLDNSLSRRLTFNGASMRPGGFTNNGARWYYESTAP